MLKKVAKKYTTNNTEKNTLKTWYSLLSLGRKLDVRAPNYLKQAIGPIMLPVLVTTLFS
jgi:2-oxoisovalerate dehydrogenase E1 component